MSQHRGAPVRPRYGRLTVLGSSLAITMIAVLGGTGVLPSTTGGHGGDGGAAAALAPAAQPSAEPTDTQTSAPPETEQLEGIFIDVEVSDEIRDDSELASKLEEVCPVDIYANDHGKVAVVRQNLDECVLCNLCVEAAPPGGVVVKKLYDGTELRR